MKKIIVFLISLVFLSGCIDYSSTVKLNKDGSGTIEETVLMSNMMTQMMKSFSQSSNDSTSNQNEFSLLDEDQLIQQAKEMGNGVKFLNAEEVTLDGKEGYKAYYSFDNIESLKLSDNPQEKIPADDMMMEEETEETPENITFSFTKGNPASLEIIFPQEDENTEEVMDSLDLGIDSTDAQMMGEQMKMFMKDFRVSMKLQVNGDIEETNAEYVDGNTITMFEMDFATLMKFPEKYEKFQKINPNSIYEIKDLLGDVPGFKLELNRKVYVKFD